MAVMGLVLVLLAGACNSDSGDGGAAGSPTSRPDPSSTTLPPVGGRTELKVDGVATRATAEPTATPVEIAFSGTLDCAAAGATGTGIFATTAVRTCAQVVEHRQLFASDADPRGRICTEIYGGPQHVKIEGSVDGERVAREITRTDGCGIADWTELEWLLGAPER
jgi:hypothetical protein